MLVSEIQGSPMIFYLVTLLLFLNCYYALKTASCLLLVFITFSSFLHCDLVSSEDLESSRIISIPRPVFETGGILIFRLPLVWISRSWPRRAPPSKTRNRPGCLMRASQLPPGVIGPAWATQTILLEGKDRISFPGIKFCLPNTGIQEALL